MGKVKVKVKLDL